MSNFSLSRKKEILLPSSIKVGDIQFPINADFRNILKILRLIEDDRIDQRRKAYHICSWFYSDAVPLNGLKEFIKFMSWEAEIDEAEYNNHAAQIPVRRYDYEFDAEEIYASFLKEYALDLLEAAFLHYRKFVIMLTNLSAESPFKQKIALRFKDLNGLKGKELSVMIAAQKAVQLPVKYTAEELREMEEFERTWGCL